MVFYLLSTQLTLKFAIRFSYPAVYDNGYINNKRIFFWHIAHRLYVLTPERLEQIIV